MKRGISLRKIILFFILCLYGSLVLFGVFHHEPWRDEAHAWMMARESTVPEIIENIQYEGVPNLWYLILKPFAILGFPYITMGLVHAALAIVAAGLVMFKSELPFLVKILIIFSYYVAYEYAVVARNYVLVALLLYIVAIVYQKRFTSPLLFAIPVSLLFHVSLQSVGFAAALAGIYLYELVKLPRILPRLALAFTIMTASGVFSVAMLVRGPMQQTIVSPSAYNIGIYYKAIRNAVVPSFPFYEPVIYGFFPSEIFISGITYAIAVSVLLMIFRKKTVFVMAIMMIGWLFWVNVIAHPAELRHRGLYLILIVFLVWIGQKTPVNSLHFHLGRAFTIVTLSSALFLSIPYLYYIYREDYGQQFSGAAGMAR